MHELSIAEAVLGVVEAHARGRRVTRVELRVGHLRQVVPDALTFAFAVVAEGTLAEGAELAIAQVPVAGRCRDCGAESELPSLPLLCPRCGSADVGITRGEELLVEALELVADPGDGVVTTNGRTTDGC